MLDARIFQIPLVPSFVFRWYGFPQTLRWTSQKMLVCRCFFSFLKVHFEAPAVHFRRCTVTPHHSCPQIVVDFFWRGTLDVKATPKTFWGIQKNCMHNLFLYFFRREKTTCISLGGVNLLLSWLGEMMQFDAYFSQIGLAIIHQL